MFQTNNASFTRVFAFVNLLRDSKLLILLSVAHLAVLATFIDINWFSRTLVRLHSRATLVNNNCRSTLLPCMSNAAGVPIDAKLALFTIAW